MLGYRCSDSRAFFNCIREALEVNVASAITTRSSDCPNCRVGRETFWYMKNLYLFDVDQARLLVADGRLAIETDEDDIHSAVRESVIEKAHISHVDPSIPGIIAHVRFKTLDGELLKGHVLIDGHHRAARCLEEGIEFRAYLLGEDESAAILMRRPADAYEPVEAIAMTN